MIKLNHGDIQNTVKIMKAGNPGACKFNQRRRHPDIATASDIATVWHFCEINICSFLTPSLISTNQYARKNKTMHNSFLVATDHADWLNNHQPIFMNIHIASSIRSWKQNKFHPRISIYARGEMRAYLATSAHKLCVVQVVSDGIVFNYYRPNLILMLILKWFEVHETTRWTCFSYRCTFYY